MKRHAANGSRTAGHSHSGSQRQSYARHQQMVDEKFADITVDHVIVSRYKGPVGAPGMPEGGNAGLPTHLLRQGVVL